MMGAKRAVLPVMCAAAAEILFLCVGNYVRAAAGTALSLEQMCHLALAEDENFRKIKTKISLEKIKYSESVKSASLKKENMITFRYSPLLSFQFPQQPDLAQAYEWQYTPIQYQCRIAALEHELSDLKYEITEEVSVLYSQAYVAQEKAKYTEERRKQKSKKAEEFLISCAADGGSSEEAKELTAETETLVGELSGYLRELEQVKGKLSDLTGIDLTTGYTFLDPFVDAQVQRNALESLVQYTLENDHAYYETKMNTQLGRISLETNESLMQEQYGSRMNLIRSYVTQAKNGEEPDSEAFRSAYEAFLDQIESPWTGSIKILFIKIPKEWFKGELDGVRYIEDDPYVLYTDALEYLDLLNEQGSAEEELRTSVEDSFEQLITARNSCRQMEESVKEQKRETERLTLLNRTGEAEYEEVKNAGDSYEEMQMELLDAQLQVSQLVYSFDRLTCGGLSEYMDDKEGWMEAARGGVPVEDSNTADPSVEPSYYIKTKIEDCMFSLGVVIPSSSEIKVTSFELWVNGKQIGQRTNVGRELSHLALTLDNIEEAEIRFFLDEEQIAVCRIDPLMTEGVLDLSEEVLTEE